MSSSTLATAVLINAFLKTTVRNNVSVLRTVVLRKALVDTRATGCKTQQLSCFDALL
jgi:hypothetical protein